METLPKIPDGYVTIKELVELAERNHKTVRSRLAQAGVQGQFFQLRAKTRVLIYPQREALYAALDK